MRWIALSFGVVVLSGCGTTSPIVSEEFGMSTPAIGHNGCAMYGWTKGEARDFIFFADETRARYDSVSGPVDLEADTSFPALNYTDPAGKPVEVRLGAGEAMVGGTRFPNARIVTQTDEGWERLRPVAIVQSCQAK